MKVSLYQREDTDKWYLRYRDHDGHMKRVSTGTADKEVARRMADRLEAELLKSKPPLGEGADGEETGADPLDRQFEDLENLMLEIGRHQAQGMEIAAKRMIQLLRRMTMRLCELEDEVAEMSGSPETL